MNDTVEWALGSSADAASKGARKLRIAMISPEHWNRVMGGAEYQVKLLMQRLQEKSDVDIRYFAARTGKQTKFDSHEVVSVGRGGFLSKYGRFWDIFRLYRALEKFGPDVIYQRVGCSYTAVAAHYARKHDVSCIWHVANEADTDPSPSWKTALSKPHYYLERFLFDFGRQRVTSIIVQSERQAKLLRDNTGLDADRRIRNFHPLPTENIEKDTNFTVCWVANLKALKCPEKVFDVAAKLEMSKAIRILMIGQPYPVASRQRHFEQLVSKHRNVTYIPGLPQRQVNDLLMRSHLLINTSPREGFSNVFIQAWMRGTPVLTLGVNPDGLLDDGILGGAYSNPEELAEAVKALAVDRQRLSAMSRQCREVSNAMFSMRNADDLVKIITESVANSPGCGGMEAPA